jgi:hypothetical protein
MRHLHETADALGTEKGKTMNDTTKQIFTVERAFLVPVFKHIAVEAANADEACRLALDEDRFDWEGQIADYENARATYVDAVFPGSKAYGEDGKLRSLSVPDDLRNPELARSDALTAIVRELIFGDGTVASLQRTLDLCNAARDRFGIERERHLCDVAGCDNVAEQGTVCNSCLPGIVGEPVATAPAWVTGAGPVQHVTTPAGTFDVEEQS